MIWKPEEKVDYVNNIDRQKIDVLLKTSNTLSVKGLTQQLNNILLEPATRITVGKSRLVKKRACKYIKYSKASKLLRREYHRAKHENNIHKNAETKQGLRTKSKDYKKEVKKVIRESKAAVIQKLRNLKSRDTKEFWKILQNSRKSDINLGTNELYEHFKKLAGANMDSGEKKLELEEGYVAGLDTSELNAQLTEAEIVRNIKKLKNNKSAGIDYLLNEHIKCTATLLMPLYLVLFNKILNTGEIPEEWLTGLIIPIFKKKGSKEDCNNYRGITLLSCLGKLFTSILNNRLYAFCEENKILGESQAGFRKGYSTLDHIFVLKNAIDLFLTEKKKLFCCFVDYTKAFDMVWREALWYKLLKYGVSGKVLNVIKGMYARVRSCVLLNGERSDYFIASKGVRQGENLSPLLFALFVNDLEEHLLSKECTYAQLPADTRDNYLKLLVLMYADDTILIADSAKKLKQAIHSMESYCDKWQLNVNKAKTKIMIFSKVKAKTHKYKFTHEDTELEIVDNYKYLGLTLAHKSLHTSLACHVLLNWKKQATRPAYRPTIGAF